MKWIVTGGTGFVGAALVRALEKKKEEVIIFSRRERAATEHVRTIVWDPEKQGDWACEVDGADVFVHLTGEPVAERWTEERVSRIRSSRVESTRLVAEAIALAEKKPRVFVSGSAVGIYGMRKDDAELDETNAPGNDLLAEICVAWEEAAEPAVRAGVRVCHPRIGIVLGKDGGMLQKMLPAFRAFVGGPVGDGRQWVSFIHLDDTVRALLFAVENEKLSGAFNVTAPEPVTMNDLSRAIARTIHRPNFFRVPSVAVRLALGKKMGDVALTGQRVLPRKLLDFGFEFRFPNVDAALEELLIRQ